MKEITIDENMKGVLVYAKPKSGTYPKNEWLVLIHHVEKASYDGHLRLIRTISYDLSNQEEYFSYYGTGNWGSIKNYNFYYPTEEQKNIIRRILVKNRCKFIKPFNKLKVYYK